MVLRLSIGLIGMAIAMPCFAATPAATKRLFDFAVYTKNGIFSQRSDYLGITGSGGTIELVNFHIGRTRVARIPSLLPATGTNNSENLGVLTNQKLTFTDGSIFRVIKSDGKTEYLTLSPGEQKIRSNKKEIELQGIKTTDPHINRVNYSSVKTVQGKSEYFDAKGLALQMTALSADLSRPGKLIAAYAPKLVKNNVFRGTDAINIFQADARDFSVKGTPIVIEASPSSLVIINIYGSIVEVTDRKFLVKGIQPQNVLFNFPEATLITIANSGDAPDLNGETLGIPGTVLAPNAEVVFYNARISGSLYAGSVTMPKIPYLRGGQVNDYCFAGSAQIPVGCNAPVPALASK